MKVISFIFNNGHNIVEAGPVTITRPSLSNIELDYIFRKAAREAVTDYDPKAWLALKRKLSSTKQNLKNKSKKGLRIVYREKERYFSSLEEELPDAD